MDLKADYPWIQTPVIVSAPMRLIALADLTVEVSRAGGIGFIGAGTDLSTLPAKLAKAKDLLQSTSPPLPTRSNTLPIGIGFINHSAPLAEALPLIAQYRPAAVWFFAPINLKDLVTWTTRTREVSNGETRVWVQVGTVQDAIEVVKGCEPDVLVVQGGDAGGHGLTRGAGVVSLVPEVIDAVGEVVKREGGKMPVIVAAGGVADGRGVAAALALGAQGVCMGTRFLAADEAVLAKGYRDEVLRAQDGGVTTVRTRLYDSLRGTSGWPERYGGRGVVNRSWVDAERGMGEEENRRLYEEAVGRGDGGWGVEGRLTTYAGTGVGLVRKRQGAREIVEEVREGARAVVKKLAGAYSEDKL